MGKGKRWVACPVEQEYFGDDRKLGKMERKLATAKDRSKYKKTDRAKQQQKEIKIDKDKLSRGRVIAISSQGIHVDFQGKQICCFLRGVLKKNKSQLKNLVVVGDFVLFEPTEEDEGVIAHIEPRQSILSRADNLSRRKEQLIAANIDQVLIIASIASPELKPSLIDRYIIAAQKGNMAPVIIINKIDLLGEHPEEHELLQELVRAYQAISLPVIPISIVTGEGIPELCQIMQNKVSVFAGQSGVGKSSLINKISGLNLRTGEIVDRTQKGSHTTTQASLMPLPFGGWCIDTPGIKSFGIWDLQKEEMEAHFTEIYTMGRKCKFPDCTHTTEHSCAVKEAVEEGKISPLRYQSYLNLFEELDQKHKRR